MTPDHAAAPDLDSLTYRLRARGTASDDQEWHDKDCLKAADAISTLRARAEAAEADAKRLRDIVEKVTLAVCDTPVGSTSAEVKKRVLAAFAQGGSDG